MDYIESNLEQNEEVVLKIKKNLAYLIPGFLWLVIWILVGVFLTLFLGNIEKGESGEAVEKISSTKLYLWIPVIILGLINLVLRLINFFWMSLAVTNKRVLGRIGLLRVYALDIHIDKIDHVEIKASFLGRLFHYYSVQIFSVGGAGMNNARMKFNTGKFFKFVGVSNAAEFKNTVNRAIELHAEEARKAQAAEIAAAMSGVKK